MKTGIWTAALVLVCTFVGSAARPAGQQAADVSAQMANFERNIVLGAALVERPATQAELDEVRGLARRGLAAARRAVASDPSSAEASYLLGSWLLYGYRVVESEVVGGGTEGGGAEKAALRVVQGLSDSPDEGLAALQKATELAPGRGDYVLDYAAALFDSGRGFEATGVLNGAWAGRPKLSPQEKMRAGLLLSNICATEGRFEEARRWAYSALGVEPENAPVVERLRQLDAARMATEAERRGPAGPEVVEEQPEAEAAGESAGLEEGAPEEPGATAEEGYGQPSEEQPEEEYQEGAGEEPGAGYEEGAGEESQGQYEEGTGEEPQQYEQGTGEGPQEQYNAGGE